MNIIWLWIPVTLELIVLVALVAIMGVLWQWQHRFKQARSHIRQLVKDPQLQLRSLTKGLGKLVEFSVFTWVLPRPLKVPVMIGYQVFKQLK